MVEQIALICEEYHCSEQRTKFRHSSVNITSTCREFVKQNEYGFQRKISDTDKTFSIFQILEKNGNSVH